MRELKLKTKDKRGTKHLDGELDGEILTIDLYWEALQGGAL